MGGMRRLFRLLFRTLILLVLAVAALIVLYRFVDPPITPLMLIRLAEGEGLEKENRPFAGFDRDLARAVIASEDNRFCSHHGIDWNAIGEAVAEFDEGGRLRGASTITMQLARNLFLWPGGGFLRKGIEAPIALAIDAAWPKRRVIEVYLNVVEWGPGAYGAEAGAKAAFGKGASRLSRREAALLAAILPNPRRFSAARPSAHVERRAANIAARIDKLGGYFTCLD